MLGLEWHFMGIISHIYLFNRSVSLIETPCSVFKVSKKDRIGYNQIRVGNEVVGVLPIGYNDVNLDGMTNIYQKGQKYALIGKSCMNHTHF